jgi:glycosyltransferase involved in cell wall biosynthesis
MNILLLSLDQSLLEHRPKMGDALQRHMTYLSMLREYSSSSSMDILVKGQADKEFVPPETEGLRFYAAGTSALTFLLNTCRVGSQLYKRKRIDLITAQTPFLDGVAGVLLKKRTGTPLLVQLHLSNLDDTYWLAESPLNWLRRLVGLWTLRHADGVRVSHPKTERWCRTRCPGRPVFVVPMAATLPLPQLYVRPTSPTILFVGRLVWEKNVALLLKAFAEVHRVVPEASLVLVGDGPERPKLEQLAVKLIPQGAITFAGAVQHREIGHYYEQASLLALPSRCESYGLVILEAMSYGRPVVATNTEGSTTLLKESFGFIVPQEDVAALAAQLLALLQNSALAEQMGRAAWSWIRQSYSPQKLQSQWVKTWLQVAGQKTDEAL